MIGFDLGSVDPIETLGLHTASGNPDIKIPTAVLAYVSDDGETWRFVTDLVNEVLPEGASVRRRFVSGDYWTGGLRVGGRYLAFYAVNGGGRTFIDEIEALRGSRDPAEAVFNAAAIGKDQLEADALNRASGATPQAGSFRHMSTWIRKSYSDAILQTKPAEERRMDNLERYVAIDNKGNWPNLTLMPDGSIVATVFGEPAPRLVGRQHRVLDQPGRRQDLVLFERGGAPRTRDQPHDLRSRPDPRRRPWSSWPAAGATSRPEGANRPSPTRRDSF